MRFILTPVGSGGDVHPYIGIGRELRRRGHDVYLIASVVFRESVEAAGIEFVPVGTVEDYERATFDPDLWHPRRGVRVVMRIIGENLERSFEAIESVWKKGESVLVGHSVAFQSRVFEEIHRLPSVTLHLSPNVFRSEYEQPALSPGMNPTALPRFLKRFMWWALDRFVIDPMIAPTLNRWRGERDLPPVSRVFHDWIHSPQGVIALFPDWFAAPQPDWPAQLRFAGFPLFDDPHRNESDPDLDEWLNRGEPPIIFTPGTANMRAASFFSAAVEAVSRLRRRGLFLTTFVDHLPDFDTDRIRHAPYIPFSTILPRCAAIVHHGGIGTCAQGLAAGIPQLVMPMGFDQPDNADRLARLGVGAWLVPARFTGREVGRSLGRLIDDPRVRRACEIARQRIQQDAGVATVCDMLEAAG